MTDPLDFHVRPYNPTLDEDGVIYLWLVSYAKSRYARDLGLIPVLSDFADSQERYYKDHRKVVLHLLEKADTHVIADPKMPSSIWGFACTEGDNIVHYACIKRSFMREGLGPQLYQALLGNFFERECLLSHQIVDFREHEMVQAKCTMPPKWKLDSWLMTRRLLEAA